MISVPNASSAKLTTNFQEFDRKLRAWAVGRPEREVTKLQRLLVLEALKGVVFMTPVDTGRARGNWQVSIGEPASSIPFNPGRNRKGRFVSSSKLSGEQAASFAIQAGEQVVAQIPPFSLVWISNNVEYILVLEFGLFDPANPGPSEDPRSDREGKVLVSGGFSIQAPHGMVGVTIARLQAEIFG